MWIVLRWLLAFAMLFISGLVLVVAVIQDGSVGAPQDSTSGRDLYIFAAVCFAIFVALVATMKTKRP